VRVGIGYDLHRMVRGRELVLGGIKIPHSKGLQGHSDGDALSHALIDSLLGAMGIEDIGEYFPDTSKKYKGISSMLLLSKVMGLVKKKGYRVLNADTIVVAEKPRLGPFKDKIKNKLALALKIRPGQISVKAKTAEGLGLLGKGKALSAYSIVALTRIRH
jgi:2-C-methyl-D-erythritol 2,4-cyclodiphosphate synthase